MQLEGHSQGELMDRNGCDEKDEVIPERKRRWEKPSH